MLWVKLQQKIKYFMQKKAIVVIKKAQLKCWALKKYEMYYLRLLSATLIRQIIPPIKAYVEGSGITAKSLL